MTPERRKKPGESIVCRVSRLQAGGIQAEPGCLLELRRRKGRPRQLVCRIEHRIGQRALESSEGSLGQSVED